MILLSEDIQMNISYDDGPYSRYQDYQLNLT